MEQSGTYRFQGLLIPNVVYRADNTTGEFNRCDMQRSIPRIILETIATAAMVVLLLYFLYGPPT